MPITVKHTNNQNTIIVPAVISLGDENQKERVISQPVMPIAAVLHSDCGSIYNSNIKCPACMYS